MNSTDWKIAITKDLLKELKRRGLVLTILGKLEELSRRLRAEPERTLRVLMREPVIFELGEFKVRRLRVGNYRLFYIIDHGRKYIVFFDIKPRRKAYRRK